MRTSSSENNGRNNSDNKYLIPNEYIFPNQVMRSTGRGSRDIHSMFESLKPYIVAILSNEICQNSSINNK